MTYSYKEQLLHLFWIATVDGQVHKKVECPMQLIKVQFRNIYRPEVNWNLTKT